MYTFYKVYSYIDSSNINHHTISYIVLLDWVLLEIFLYKVLSLQTVTGNITFKISVIYTLTLYSRSVGH